MNFKDPTTSKMDLRDQVLASIKWTIILVTPLKNIHILYHKYRLLVLMPIINRILPPVLIRSHNIYHLQALKKNVMQHIRNMSIKI